MKDARPQTFRLGLPKGRLHAHSLHLLVKLGIVEPNPLQYQFHVTDSGLSVFLLKPRDIVNLVATSVLDAGIAADEWITDSCNLERLRQLPWCPARLCMLAANSRFLRKSVAPVLVATEFSWAAEKFLRPEYPNMRLIQISGSAEAFVPHLADCIVDCVETGATAKANGLKIVRDLMTSDVHLICRVGEDVGRLNAFLGSFLADDSQSSEVSIARL